MSASQHERNPRRVSEARSASNGHASRLGSFRACRLASLQSTRSRYPDTSNQTLPREAWFATRDAEAFAIVLDKDGRIAWGRSDIGGDPLVVVLCDHVSDAHTAGLPADGVSCIFAGRARLFARTTSKRDAKS